MRYCYRFYLTLIETDIQRTYSSRVTDSLVESHGEMPSTREFEKDGERQPTPVGFLGVLTKKSEVIQKNDFVRSQLV